MGRAGQGRGGPEGTLQTSQAGEARASALREGCGTFQSQKGTGLVLWVNLRLQGCDCLGLASFMAVKLSWKDIRLANVRTS